MADLGRSLILVGVLLAVVGVLVLAAGKIPWLGRLPGDFTYRRDGLVIHFPLGTCILLSVLASVLLSLFLRR